MSEEEREKKMKDFVKKYEKDLKVMLPPSVGKSVIRKAFYSLLGVGCN